MDRASPGRTLAAIGRGLIRLPRAIGRGSAAFWAGFSVRARRRLAAAGAAVVALLLFFGLAVPNLPCQLPGGDSCPPDDDAAMLVPADALAYLHTNLDPDVDQFEQATQIQEQIPVLSGQIVDRALAQLPRPPGGSLNFEDDVRPWFGGEAAIAVLATASGPAERVVLLEAEDSEGATSFAEQVSVGVGESEELEGVELAVDQRGTATAQTDGFLLIGPRDGVAAVIETATAAEGAEPLADEETATEVRDELPEHRFAEAYLSADGIDDLVVEARGTLGSLTPLLAPGASRAAAASLTASDDSGIELAVRSVLDSERAQAEPGFFAAFPLFEPALPERLPAGSLAYLGIGEPRTAVGALVAQASAQAPGIAASFEDLVESLRGEVDLERDLLDALGGEAAFALQPKPVETGSAVPFLEFVADGVDEDAARRALASLQGPLADSVDTGSSGQAAGFGEQEIEGVQARSLRISPTVELTYAVFDGLAAIATDAEGIAQLVGDGEDLAGSDLYQRATEDFDDEVSLVSFFDLGELVVLGEQLGLAEDPLYATFASQFRRLDALGVAVSASDELLSTDARLLLTSDDAAGEQSTLGPTPSD